MVSPLRKPDSWRGVGDAKVVGTTIVGLLGGGGVFDDDCLGCWKSMLDIEEGRKPYKRK